MLCVQYYRFELPEPCSANGPVRVAAIIVGVQGAIVILEETHGRCSELTRFGFVKKPAVLFYLMINRDLLIN